jgi:hypothetical protein
MPRVRVLKGEFFPDRRVHDAGLMSNLEKPVRSMVNGLYVPNNALSANNWYESFTELQDAVSLKGFILEDTLLCIAETTEPKYPIYTTGTPKLLVALVKIEEEMDTNTIPLPSD